MSSPSRATSSGVLVVRILSIALVATGCACQEDTGPSEERPKDTHEVRGRWDTGDRRVSPNTAEKGEVPTTHHTTDPQLPLGRAPRHQQEIAMEGDRAEQEGGNARATDEVSRGHARHGPNEGLDQQVLARTRAQDLEGLTLALQAGGDADARDAAGLTALYCAAHGGDLRCVAVLLQHGATPGKKTAGGYTALYTAAGMGHVEVVRVLLTHGAPVDSQSRMWRDTPLHRAAAEGHAPVVRILLEAGADPNARNHGGQTAMHKAAFWGHRETLNALVQGGADMTLKDDIGATAADTASDRGHSAAAKLLWDAR